MRKRTDAQIADAALCNLAKNVQEWLEKWEFTIDNPAAVNQLNDILDEA